MHRSEDVWVKRAMFVFLCLFQFHCGGTASEETSAAPLPYTPRSPGPSTVANTGLTMGTGTNESVPGEASRVSESPDETSEGVTLTLEGGGDGAEEESGGSDNLPTGEDSDAAADPTADEDNDLIFDIYDNCPGIGNPGQEDFDDDGVGNACDSDIDGDGMVNLEDCAPFDPNVHANAKELCNGLDDNCNDLIDEEPEDACVLFYPDGDGDGSGALGEGICMCGPTAEYPTPFGGDCNDSNPLISAFAEETCDDQDNNCNDLVDEGCDDDQDGYCDVGKIVVGTPAVCTLGGNDCVDYSAEIFPGATEIPGDGFDNDCDGTAQGEATGEFIVVCPEDCPSIPDPVDAFLCGLGMCFDEYIQTAAFGSPTGDDFSNSFATVNHFGNPSNDLAPFEGSSYGLMASGPATGLSHSQDLEGGTSIPDPFSSDGFTTKDNIELTVEMVSPPGAIGFSVDYVFFSQEYEEWIGSSFNDKFYIILQAPQTTAGQKTVINTTACSNPSSYYDIIDDQGSKQCFIAINTAFSEPCSNVATDISGTGFECSSGGSSTGWLTTSWPIGENEPFTLIFHIHDTSDGILDSEVILDNFRFETIPGSFDKGTTTAN